MMFQVSQFLSLFPIAVVLVFYHDLSLFWLLDLLSFAYASLTVDWQSPPRVITAVATIVSFIISSACCCTPSWGRSDVFIIFSIVCITRIRGMFHDVIFWHDGSLRSCPGFWCGTWSGWRFRRVRSILSFVSSSYRWLIKSSRYDM